MSCVFFSLARLHACVFLLTLTLFITDDDHPFIVLTETKFSLRCIPVWARYSPHRTRVEK